MAKTIKAMIFHNIKEVELLISAIQKSATDAVPVYVKYNDAEIQMLLNMGDVLEQVREMFIKETREKTNG